MSLEQELTGSGQADPYAVKQYWTEIVRSAADRGKLEKIPTRKAQTTKERDQARAQNAAITTKSFGGWGENYDRIFRSSLANYSSGYHLTDRNEQDVPY